MYSLLMMAKTCRRDHPRYARRSLPFLYQVEALVHRWAQVSATIAGSQLTDNHKSTPGHLPDDGRCLLPLAARSLHHTPNSSSLIIDTILPRASVFLRHLHDLGIDIRWYQRAPGQANINMVFRPDDDRCLIMSADGSLGDGIEILDFRTGERV
jgi:hypothetical protein